MSRRLSLVTMLVAACLSYCPPVRAQVPTVKATFFSDPTWEVTNSAGTFLGLARNVCLNFAWPRNCPSGALLYGFGGGGWVADLSSIPRATWVWAPGISGLTFPALPAQYSFSKTFHLLGTPTAGVISVAADDMAEVFVNEMFVGRIGSLTNGTAAGAAQTSVTSFNITNFLVPGGNVITVRASNGTFGCGTGPYQCNPAGVVFGGSLEVAPALSVSPATVIVGLRNSDDIGTRFDLRAELRLNGTVLTSGTVRCIAHLVRDPTKATAVTIAFDPIPVLISPSDILTLSVLTRIGTNPDGTKCPGHNGASGLRLYYDSVGRSSGFDIEISPGENLDLFLRSDGLACKDAPSVGVTSRFLDDSPPIDAAAKCKDSAGISFLRGNPWTEIGSWDLTP